MNPTLGDNPQAGHHFLLVHVETGTALMQCFHAHLPRGGRREALASGSLPNVLRDRRRPQLAGDRPWRQERVLEGPPIKLSNGLAHTKAEPISLPATPTITVSSSRVRHANGNSVRLAAYLETRSGWIMRRS